MRRRIGKTCPIEEGRYVAASAEVRARAASCRVVRRPFGVSQLTARWRSGFI